MASYVDAVDSVARLNLTLDRGSLQVLQPSSAARRRKGDVQSYNEGKYELEPKRFAMDTYG